MQMKKKKNPKMIPQKMKRTILTKKKRMNEFISSNN